MLTRMFQLAFWSALLFALVMASLPQAPSIPGDPNDKLQHIVAFVVLAGLAAAAFPSIRLLTIFSGLAAFGALIEIVQLIPWLGRYPSLLDWLADIIAAGSVLALAWGLRRMRGAHAA